jgi:hypothetical protein
MTERAMAKAGLAVALAALAAMAVIMLAGHQAPLLSDYVDWVYQGLLLSHVFKGHPDSAYLLKNYAVPNSLTTFGLGVLMVLMPWKIAAKVWLILGMIGGLLCADRLQRAAGKRQGWRILVVTGTALIGITWWCGFTNFLLGTYLAMLLCALLLEGFESRWIYAVLLAVLFFAHMIPFGFGLLVLGLYAAQTGRWRLLWQALPSVGLCLWYFAGLLTHHNADAQTGMEASVPYMTPVYAAFRVNTYLKCWGFVNTTSTFQDSVLLKLVGTKVFVLLFLLNAVIAAAVLVLLWRTASEAIRGKTAARFFWLAVSIFFVVALLMPGAVAGISDPGGRMLQVAVWCGVCMVTTRKQWSGVALSACAMVLIAFSCYQMSAVAMQPGVVGTTGGPVPGWMRKFGHVVYIGRQGDYECIEKNDMRCVIYPTAMFLNKPAGR